MFAAIKAAILMVATIAALLIPAAPAHADDCRPAPNGFMLCQRDDGSVVVCAAGLPGGPCMPWGGVFPPPQP
jgi:hypothetical protein